MEKFDVKSLTKDQSNNKILKIKNTFPRQKLFKPYLKNLNFIARDCQNDENMA